MALVTLNIKIHIRNSLDFVCIICIIDYVHVSVYIYIFIYIYTFILTFLEKRRQF